MKNRPNLVVVIIWALGLPIVRHSDLPPKKKKEKTLVDQYTRRKQW